MKRIRFYLGIIGTLFMWYGVVAAVPSFINFQGSLSDGSGNPVDDPALPMVFSIYVDPTTLTSLWSETQTVNVNKGGYNVKLGSVTSFPTGLFDDNDVLYLGVKVGGDPEMTPRTEISSIPFAMKAGQAAKADSAKQAAKADSSKHSAKADSAKQAAKADSSKHSAKADSSKHSAKADSSKHAERAKKCDTCDVALALVDNSVSSIKIIDGTIQLTDLGQNGASNGQILKWNGSTWVAANDEAGSGTFLPLAGGTMTGAISNTGDPPITMGKGNFGAGSSNPGIQAFVAGSNDSATGDYSVVGGGYSNTASGGAATVSGGAYSTASGGNATVGGGNVNNASNANATVGGGYSNTASGEAATVSGGSDNIATSYGATISGGTNNTANGAQATVGGGNDNTASGLGTPTVGGGNMNTASGSEATVAGGESNSASGNFSTVGGGQSDTASSDHATIGGGRGNTAVGSHATIGGGEGNRTNDDHTTVSGGQNNSAIVGNWTTVGGGVDNTASGEAATVGGGEGNLADGNRATVPGGEFNEASGNYSFAAGRRARADHAGAFVWADGTGPGFASTADNQFLIRADGGVGVGTNSPQGALDISSTTGAFIVPRMTTAQRNALTPVNGMIIYNTDAGPGGRFEFREAGAWVTK